MHPRMLGMHITTGQRPMTRPASISWLSLKGQKEREENVIHSKRFAPSSSRSKKIQKKKGGKGKYPTATAEGKGKAKVAIKGNCFHCNVDEHWKRNCPKYLAKKKIKEEQKSEALEKFNEYKAKVENLLIGPSSSVDETATSGQSHLSQSLRMPRHSGRIVSQPNHYLSLTETQVVIPDDGVEDPLSYKQAMNDVKPIGCKWIYNRKRDSTGKVQTFKARLVAKEYTQREGIDYEKTFSPVAINLEDSIFMSQSKGFITQGQEQKVCKLNRSIYGLKQASRSWNIRFDTAIKSYGFVQNVDEPFLKIKKVQFKMKDLHGVHLFKTLQEVEDMRHIPYALVVGSLMYAMLCIRPNICYAVQIVNRKSMSGSVFNLKKETVVWRSIKQGYIVDSTMEVEYVAAYEAEKEAIWLKKLLHNLEIVLNMNLDVSVTKIASEHNIADPFAKTLKAKVFEGHLENLGLRDMNISGCIVDGVRFHMIDRDFRRTTQNNGVMVVGESSASESDNNNFYGVLDQVLSIQYPMGCHVWLFKCRWFNTNKNKNHRTHVELGYKSINTSHFWFPEESVILATQVHQVFYIDNPKNGRNWKVIQVVQNKRIWDIPKVVGSHCVADHIEDDTLCRLDVDPIVVERPTIRHVIDNFINDDDEQLSVQSGSSDDE
ncbi:gag/pol protein [Cucumis melo var. makuwa]|uniref:Gag/pol protein n=1 Tax=Cucumis melo var. makuwa TaxID=1194695 RepID=A0A5D3C8I5_CUCMM|nr:gag/pol protein [Cucumis melo var. makuwa]